MVTTMLSIRGAVALDSDSRVAEASGAFGTTRSLVRLFCHQQLLCHRHWATDRACKWRHKDSLPKHMRKERKSAGVHLTWRHEGVSEAWMLVTWGARSLREPGSRGHGFP